MLVILQRGLRVEWNDRHPTVKRLDGGYSDRVRVAAKEMKEHEARLQRSATLPKCDIRIPADAIGQDRDAGSGSRLLAVGARVGGSMRPYDRSKAAMRVIFSSPAVFVGS